MCEVAGGGVGGCYLRFMCEGEGKGRTELNGFERVLAPECLYLREGGVQLGLGGGGRCGCKQVRSVNEFVTGA